jgi:hypothetical protein
MWYQSSFSTAAAARCLLVFRHNHHRPASDGVGCWVLAAQHPHSRFAAVLIIAAIKQTRKMIDIALG